MRLEPLSMDFRAEFPLQDARRDFLCKKYPDFYAIRSVGVGQETPREREMHIIFARMLPLNLIDFAMPVFDLSMLNAKGERKTLEPIADASTEILLFIKDSDRDFVREYAFAIGMTLKYTHRFALSAARKLGAC